MLDLPVQVKIILIFHLINIYSKAKEFLMNNFMCSIYSRVDVESSSVVSKVTPSLKNDFDKLDIKVYTIFDI